MLGNGAYTDYGRDSYGRLTSFDIKEISGNRILKHEWQYDSMGRKSAAAGITVSGGSPALPSPISFAYDAASRVTNEALNNTWSVSYGYDKAGNRTSVNDGTINRTIGYGVKNRESSVSGGIDPLEYDFKGNVTHRMTLDGTKTFDYTWDAYDRLVGSDNGTVQVAYDYDAMGRLLRRTRTEGSGTSTTINYWLGLNKIAEERWGAESGNDLEIFRPDDEVEEYPADNGWGFESTWGDPSQQMEYVNDSARGKVIRIWAESGLAYAGIGDMSWNFNPNDTPWADAERRHLSLWIKAGESASVEAQSFVRVIDQYQQESVEKITFPLTGGSPYLNGGTLVWPLGAGKADGAWHYIEIDLALVQSTLVPSKTITAVDSLLIYATDAYVDDLMLSGGALERSYGLGYTGAQTGSTGARDVNTRAESVSAWGKYYYHINEQATVIAASNANGTTLGVYEPNFFGKYTYIAGNRVDELGLWSLFLDNDSSTYVSSESGTIYLDMDRGRYLQTNTYRKIWGRMLARKTKPIPSVTHVYNYVSTNNPINRGGNSSSLPPSSSTSNSPISFPNFPVPQPNSTAPQAPMAPNTSPTPKGSGSLANDCHVGDHSGIKEKRQFEEDCEMVCELFHAAEGVGFVVEIGMSGKLAVNPEIALSYGILCGKICDFVKNKGGMWCGIAFNKCRERCGKYGSDSPEYGNCLQDCTNGKTACEKMAGQVVE